MVDESTNDTIFPAYNITYVQGVPIGFIGISLKDTPSKVTPSGVEGLRFLDEAETINEQVEKLKDKGVETIVVIIHDGGSQEGLYNESLNMSGPIVDVIKATDDGVDVFVTGHTHQAYLGDVIADAQLYATSNPEDDGAVVAFMNQGGIRADLVYDQLSGGELPGQITYGEAFSVQPFGNILTSGTKKAFWDQFTRSPAS